MRTTFRLHVRDVTPKVMHPKYSYLKPDPDRLSEKQVQNPTMADFWLEQGWYTKKQGVLKLRRADWKNNPQLRSKAVRFLVGEVLKKKPKDMVTEDFDSNFLGGLLARYYRASVYGALKAAGYALHPWELPRTPTNFYETRENRVKAIKWLVRECKKAGTQLCDIIDKDFISRRLGGLLVDYYEKSAGRALKDAGYRINPWERIRAPNRYYKSKPNRIKTAEWLVNELKGVKPPRDIIQTDFYSKGLNGLLHYHKGSPFDALFEAGVVTKKDEAYMRRNGQARYAPVD
jgi:hypothetical protein